MKIKIDTIPTETKTYETANGWRTEVVWMAQWAKGASILGRGNDPKSSEADFRRRAKDDGQEITEHRA